MPSRQQQSGGQRRSQGGGRAANSEPRLQVFRDFAGVNFEHANQVYGGMPMDVARKGADQSDLQMNFTFLQNNVAVRSNKTLETRDDITTLFTPGSSTEFTGPVCLIGSKLYAAKSDGRIGVGDLGNAPAPMTGTVNTDNQTGSGHTWTSLDYYDDKLIAMTEENEMWTGDVAGSYFVNSVQNAREVPDPEQIRFEDIHGVNLTVVEEISSECPFRVELAYTYVNKYGPTLISPTITFYANHPVSEWHTGMYARVQGTVPSGYGVKAVELYYATDNAMSMLFLDRVDTDGTTWAYNWHGYIDATSMWPVANLVAPTENYTKGVHASRVCNVDGRLYFWGDKDQPQRLYIGGNPGNLLSISPGTGGGFVDVEPGTGQEVRYVCKYKTQSGASIVTMLCDSPNSRKEQRFNLVENNISLSNEQSMKSWQAEQVAGAVGCKSYHGAVVCEDGLYSVSRYGLALTTMTMEYNSQIRANYVSDPIKPAFTDAINTDLRLSNAVLFECDGIIYMAMGSSDSAGNLDNVLFCYDIDLKAWWTYTIDVDSPILNMFHVDWQGAREGIGIVTADGIYLLPTTVSDDESEPAGHSFLVETAKLSTQMPQQAWQYLSQLEFHFDYFVGDMLIELRMTDMFGRDITVRKSVSESSVRYDHVVHMRVDQRVMSYVITMTGTARFRMSHFLARVYTISNKMGQVWGFDDSISHRSAGSVHPTFKCYNDVRKAIIP